MGERKIFIAVDGSAASDMAFSWYLDNMNRAGDQVFLVHSAEYNVDFGMPGAYADVQALSQAVKSEDDRIGNMTGNYIQKLKQRDIKGQTLMVKAQKPGQAIVDAAAKEGASCIIMGSRGLGTFRSTLLGSVSQYVLHHAPPKCAVTILRES